ncbi:hypothetical protein ANCDUO_03304 [Ancylostoma duodenale]|uniref:Uncharacterized protein n=1 Tax=Ancylostoma duodenale TaxID=51022 RepID=A0A0C2DUA5_9BILA|nr:hypothetical protein ANCDUO_03304 [Ancylostoma duodenale]
MVNVTQGVCAKKDIIEATRTVIPSQVHVYQQRSAKQNLVWIRMPSENLVAWQRCAKQPVHVETKIMR